MISMQTQDTTLTCSECGQEFTFTANEQLLYAQKGYSRPGLCAFCRAARKIASGAGNQAGARGDGRRMYPAVCASCGKQTMVPFEPRANRPVYCSQCHQERSGTGSRRYPGSYRRS